MKKVIIYTDGSCSGNPGDGGWGAVLIYGEIEKQIYGGEHATTNNRMEIMAVIEALRCIRMPCQCTIHSDSAYVVNAFNEGWLTKWEASSWKTADKKEVKNIDLWQKLLLEVKKHIVTFVKVKGHNNDHYNEICDTLAKKGVSELI